jgi:hypothetical protein
MAMEYFKPSKLSKYKIQTRKSGLDDMRKLGKVRKIVHSIHFFSHFHIAGYCCCALKSAHKLWHNLCAVPSLREFFKSSSDLRAAGLWSTLVGTSLLSVFSGSFLLLHPPRFPLEVVLQTHPQTTPRVQNANISHGSVSQ